MESSEYSVPDGFESAGYKICAFCLNVWQVVKVTTLMILAVCTFVSLIVGVATGGWPSAAQYGLGIVLSFLLIVFVTAISYYRYLQFRQLDSWNELDLEKIRQLKRWAAVADKFCDKTGSGVGGRNMKKLKYHERISGITEKLGTSTANGLPVDRGSLNLGQVHSGIYRFTESEPSAFWMYVLQALKVTTLMILAVCTFVSLIVGVATGGWPSVALYGLGIVLSFLLVVFVTAISYYRHLQFRHLDRHKKWSLRKFHRLEFGVEEFLSSTTNRVELNSWPAVTDKICDEWGSGVGGRNMKKLKYHGRVSGTTEKLHKSTTNVSQALKVRPLEFLAGLAFVFLIGSLATGEWPSGDLYGLGLEIVLAILLVVMIQKFWMKGSFPSTLVAINKLLIACFPISFCAFVTNAQPSNSAIEGDYTLKNFSRNNDEHHPLMLGVKKNWVQGTSMLDWTDIIMFIGIMLLVVTLYYHNWVLSAFCTLWTHIIDLMQVLKIKMKQALVRLKENNIQYMRRGYKLSNLVIASPFLEGGHIWQVCMLVGIALFSIIFYCGEVSVELKKSQVTTSNFFFELRNNKKVLFFTARHVLEISVPLLFSLLAYVRLMEFDRKNHYTKNDWPSFALVLQVAIFVVGWLHIIMDDCNPDYFRHNDQNQLIPMQPVDTIPHKGNEIILKDRPVVPEEFSEEGGDVNDLTVVQGSAANGASVSEMVLEVAEELC